MLGSATVWARASWNIHDLLARELHLTEQATEIEHALAAIERGRAGTEYGVAVLDHAGRESLRLLAAYREQKGDREAQVRRRARALLRLSRGGIPRLTFESLDEDGMFAADRVALGRELRRLVRRDLAELSLWRRAEERAQIELLDTMRRLQGASALTTIATMQRGVLHGAAAAVDPKLVATAKTRKKEVKRRPASTRVTAAESQLLKELRRNWTELDALRDPDVKHLQAPVAGRIVGTFGEYVDPILRLPMVRNGIEIASRPREVVRAMADGRVAMISRLPGYDEVVVIDHGDGAMTLMGRLWQLAVKQGETVTRGQTIGRVAPKAIDDGLGPTVYVELRHADKPVDPTPHVSRRRHSLKQR
jgi:murein DD-endopeptidase MepM/ murein hydrolase activator NlpD